MVDKNFEVWLNDTVDDVCNVIPDPTLFRDIETPDEAFTRAGNVIQLLNLALVFDVPTRQKQEAVRNALKKGKAKEMYAGYGHLGVKPSRRHLNECMLQAVSHGRVSDVSFLKVCGFPVCRAYEHVCIVNKWAISNARKGVKFTDNISVREAVYPLEPREMFHEMEIEQEIPKSDPTEMQLFVLGHHALDRVVSETPHFMWENIQEKRLARIIVEEMKAWTNQK